MWSNGDDILCFCGECATAIDATPTADSTPASNVAPQDGERLKAMARIGCARMRADHARQRALACLQRAAYLHAKADALCKRSAEISERARAHMICPRR